MAYTVNQQNYPDVNGKKPDFFSLKLIVPGLFSGTFPVGLTAISFADKRESGKLRGNSPVMIGKTAGKYTVSKASLEMYMNDFYLAFLPFLGNLGAPLQQGAYEVAFDLDLQFSTPADPFPKSVQIVGASIGEADEDYKESPDPLKVKITLDEPFMLVRNGVVPMAKQATFWPVQST